MATLMSSSHLYNSYSTMVNKLFSLLSNNQSSCALSKTKPSALNQNVDTDFTQIHVIVCGFFLRAC